MVNFIENELRDVKADLEFHEKMLAEKSATLEGLEVLVLVSKVKEKLIIDAKSEVQWYTSRIERDRMLLDIFYTARDIQSDSVLDQIFVNKTKS